MILVVGASGTIGRVVVTQLLAKGEAVRAMSRDPEKTRALPGFEGASVVAGDPADPASLVQVFAGVDKVLLIPPSGPSWNQGEKNLIDAARAAGVKYVVKVSAMGADPAHPSMSLSFHCQGEDLLRESGIPFTVLRGNSFMQNFLLFYAPSIRSEGSIYQCTGDVATALIDTRDIADVATVLLTSGSSEHHGKVYELTGPEALSYSQAAAKIGAATGRTVRYIDVPPDAYQQALVGFGLPTWAAEEVVNIYGRGFYREGRGGKVTPVVPEILGRPARSFDEFVRDHVIQFTP